MKVHALILAGIVAAFAAHPASAASTTSGFTNATPVKPAAVQYAQMDRCSWRCQEGCGERWPGSSSSSYYRCLNRCQRLLCSGR
jgi:hypothetical protein